MDTEQKQTSLPVEIDEKAAEGTYSNFVVTAHTASEFILDFARMLPGFKKARVHSRIIMTPQSAKSLLIVLSRTVEQYEKNFGPIAPPGGPGGASPMGFHPGSDSGKSKMH
ncbi:MAG: DUF3467 domain-containing protein [Candidatus Krumholzibacteriota bacterium]|nr:DUF3467 domain-containing protein [Candidatus Krumholzibacteriota bacterium]